MPLRNTADTDREATETAKYYAGQDWQLGLRFRTAYANARARLAPDPSRFPLHPEMPGPEERYVAIAGFPYVLIFRTGPAETVILGVVHVGAGPAVYRRVAQRG